MSSNRYKTYSSLDFSIIIILIMFAIIIISLIANIYRSVSKSSANSRVEIATVTDKSVKRNKNEDKYLIFCKNQSNETVVYEITDSLLSGRFNSSDIYGEIEVGKTYRFTVAGFRNPLFSWYPNIYKAEEIE